MPTSAQLLNGSKVEGILPLQDHWRLVETGSLRQEQDKLQGRDESGREGKPCDWSEQALSDAGGTFLAGSRLLVIDLPGFVRLSDSRSKFKIAMGPSGDCFLEQQGSHVM